VIAGGLVFTTPLNAQPSTPQQNKVDDQQCQSYGARPGSDVYVNCRLRLVEMRHNEVRAAAANTSEDVPPAPSVHAQLDAALNQLKRANQRPQKLHCETISNGFYARQTDCQ
jgi:hypothetical protein